MSVATTVGWAVPKSKVARPIKIYVFTAANAGGFTDQDFKLRMYVGAELRKEIEKKDAIQTVDTAEMADVTLNVLSCGKEVIGSHTGYVPPFGMETFEDTADTLHLELRAGSYSMAIEGQEDGRITSNPWRTTAIVAAKTVENWVKENHDKLIAQRSQ
jgi:hypothetical protein